MPPVQPALPVQLVPLELLAVPQAQPVLAVPPVVAAPQAPLVATEQTVPPVPPAAQVLRVRRADRRGQRGLLLLDRRGRRERLVVLEALARRDPLEVMALTVPRVPPALADLPGLMAPRVPQVISVQPVQQVVRRVLLEARVLQDRRDLRVILVQPVPLVALELQGLLVPRVAQEAKAPRVPQVLPVPLRVLQAPPEALVAQALLVQPVPHLRLQGLRAQPVLRVPREPDLLVQPALPVQPEPVRISLYQTKGRY